MKKTFKILAMLMMASVLTFSFTSCEKDDPVEPTTTPQEQEEETPVITVQELAGTSWACSMQNTMTYQGVTMNISFDATLDFMDTEKGEYFEMAVVEVPAYPAANQQMDQSFEFTYTVKGEKILITMTYEDENGEEVTDTGEYIYNADTQTITFDTNSPEMEEFLGTDVYVFTKVQ